MVSQDQFEADARKALDAADLLKKYGQKDKTGENYQRILQKLKTELRRLKDMNIELLDCKIAETDPKMESLERNMIAGLLSENAYKSLCSELKGKRDEMLVEKESIQSGGINEYLKHLRKDIEQKDMKQEALMGGPKGLPKKRMLKDHEIPAWALATAAILFVLYAIIGLVSAGLAGLIISPLTLVFSLGFSILILHIATSVVQIESSSFSRAFTCTMMQMLLLLALGIITVLFSILLFSAGTISGLFTLFMVFLIAYFAISVYAIVKVYETTAGKAILAVIINVLILFFIQLVLGMILRALLMSYISRIAPTMLLGM